MARHKVPSGLYSHPAWLAWKETQGWRRLDSGFGFQLLARDLARGASMAYGASPPQLHDFSSECPGELGAALERLSQRLLPRLPQDCAFIRWDLMTEAWLDADGLPLARHLQELRMNASTAWRCLRKAASEGLSESTVVVELGDPDTLLSRLAARTRYSVRLAERRGTKVIRAGEAGLEAFLDLHAGTAARHGLREHPSRSFGDLFAAARDWGLALDLYLAELDGRPAAAAIIARSRDEAWYLFAASSEACREAAGPSATLYRAMRDCAEAGVRRMDLLGVSPPGAADHPLSGITRFKSGFGGRRVTRAGAWDFVLRPDVYARRANAEAGYVARGA